MSDAIRLEYEVPGDDFTRAGEASSDVKRLLKKLGVSEIEAQGQPFDPERHEAVMHVDDENLGENEVAQVFQAGFILGDRVIRHAVVQVAN